MATVMLDSIRLPTNNGKYWETHLQRFADRLECKAVIFGKHTIELLSERNTTSHALHFANKDQMLGYVVGYNNAHKFPFDELALHLKQE